MDASTAEPTTVAQNAASATLGSASEASAEAVEEHLRRVLEQRRQENVQACENELVALLQKYNCRLEASMLLRAGQVIPQVTIVANEAP